ncbi:MAG: Maf family nucleotide pyrophosphatase [Cytophagaceae bacterium]|jgi:septum formation protein|nr:Maf family nucleotide pyrophosphatase [Cytophagaceae bacterium]
MFSSAYSIILASGSPRRRELLQQVIPSFTVKTKDTPEDFPEDMPCQEVPEMLAKRKASAFEPELLENELVIAADTVVILKNKILGKPKDRHEAMDMLQQLSGNTHEVVTGVCLLSKNKKISFRETTLVNFLSLSRQDIEYYVDQFKPFDKAGSYGIQEYIGYIGISSIQGSYFNVVGLPVHAVMQALRNF